MIWVCGDAYKWNIYFFFINWLFWMPLANPGPDTLLTSLTYIVISYVFSTSYHGLLVLVVFKASRRGKIVAIPQSAATP